MFNKETGINTSPTALDRAFDKLGGKRIQEIRDSIPSIPGPTVSEYLAMSEKRLEVAFPKSDTHLCGYRIDLGYFKDDTGKEYQLGITGPLFFENNGYTCDYTITGDKTGDYCSGKLNYIEIYKKGYPNPFKWKDELFRRAIKGDHIDRDKLTPQWIDEQGNMHNYYPSSEYLTFYQFMNKLLK